MEYILYCGIKIDFVEFSDTSTFIFNFKCAALFFNVIAALVMTSVPFFNETAKVYLLHFKALHESGLDLFSTGV